MPDLDIFTAEGPLRVFALLHDARPVPINLGVPGRFDITAWTYAGAWELPALGEVALRPPS